MFALVQNGARFGPGSLFVTNRKTEVSVQESFGGWDMYGTLVLFNEAGKFEKGQRVHLGEVRGKDEAWLGVHCSTTRKSFRSMTSILRALPGLSLLSGRLRFRSTSYVDAQNN
jgi:hypothetical protein